jgi:hypothetical protein
MPRYFLHVRRGGATVLDRQGVELADIEQAAAEAVRRGREIAKQDASNGLTPTIGMIVIERRMAYGHRNSVRWRIESPSGPVPAPSPAQKTKSLCERGDLPRRNADPNCHSAAFSRLDNWTSLRSFSRQAFVKTRARGPIAGQPDNTEQKPRGPHARLSIPR